MSTRTPMGEHPTLGPVDFLSYNPDYGFEVRDLNGTTHYVDELDLSHNASPQEDRDEFGDYGAPLTQEPR